MKRPEQRDWQIIHIPYVLVIFITYFVAFSKLLFISVPHLLHLKGDGDAVCGNDYFKY